ATGPYGGVIAILYARTADSAKCVIEAGLSSHFVMSRTSEAGSCALCTQYTSPLRCDASLVLASTRYTGTRSHHASYSAITACCKPTVACAHTSTGLPSIFA